MKRYKLNYDHGNGTSMLVRHDGKWCKFSDVEAELATLRAKNERLRAAIRDMASQFDSEPEYHHQGMGCGLEDRSITDRYDAMCYGWENAMERVYSENIKWATEIAKEALK